MGVTVKKNVASTATGQPESRGSFSNIPIINITIKWMNFPLEIIMHLLIIQSNKDKLIKRVISFPHHFKKTLLLL